MKKLEVPLNDRTLRFDGVSIVTPEQVAHPISLGVPPSLLRIRGSSEEVNLFNLQVADQEKLLEEFDEPIRLDMSWRLPEKYKNLDIDEYVQTVFEFSIHDRLNYSDEQLEKACYRIVDELAEIKKRGMTEFMRTIIYVLDTFREKGIVWGVGRGSSCACYVLFILGLHVVDCVKHDVPLEEFFHD